MESEQNKSQEVMSKLHELFVLNLSLLLNDIVVTVPDTASVKANSNKLISAINSNNLDADKVSSIIKKTYTILGANVSNLEKREIKIFQLKERKNDKEVKKTIIPGIDLEEAVKYYNDDTKKSLWRYLDNIFYASVKLLHLANPTLVNEKVLAYVSIVEKTLDHKAIIEEHRKKIPTSNLVPKDNFNPFVGVGTNSSGEYGLNELMSGPKLLPNQLALGLGSMATLLGLDKMIDMEKLSQQLKNMNKKDIDEATEHIKKLLGSNVDPGTSEIINTMLHDITDELKNKELTSGNPAENLVKIAETVASKMKPKIDPKKVDMKKMWKSTQNLANNFTDEKGNKVFAGKSNPLNMLTNLMESQMKMMDNKNSGKSKADIEKEYMKDCHDMFTKMGMREEDIARLKNMDPSMLQNMLLNNNKADSKKSNSRKNTK